jgi:hypothetical protein
MPDISIRQMRVDDRLQLFHLIEAVATDDGICTTDLFDTRDLERSFVQFLQTEGAHAVAVDSTDVVVGFVSAFPRQGDDGQHFMDLRRLRATGPLAEQAAELLIEHVKQRAVAKDRGGLGTVVRQDNILALSFLTEHGFHPQPADSPGHRYLRCDC